MRITYEIVPTNNSEFPKFYIVKTKWTFWGKFSLWSEYIGQRGSTTEPFESVEQAEDYLKILLG